jgi:hypothetical protein
MLDQARIGTGANPPQQNQIKILLIHNYFKIVPRLNFSAYPDSFRDYQLPALTNIRRHEV